VIFGDKNIIYHLKVTLRALTMHWRVILIILLLRRSMKSLLEGYINNFIVEKVDEKLQLQAKM